MNKAVSILVTAATGIAGALVIGTGAAHATAPTTQVLTCDGQQLTLRTNNNSSSQMGGWSVAQIVSGGSGHLIPVVFEFSAYDNTINQPIFDGRQLKGGGNANSNQPTVTCVQQQTATLGELLNPGEPVPPGAALTDEVTFTIQATAVWQP